MKIKGFFSLLKEAFSEWNKDKGFKLGAALSYYTVFSLPPLLFLVLSIAGLLFSRETVRAQIVSQVQGLIGEQGGQMIETMLDRAFSGGGGLIAAGISILVLLFGATGVFAELQDSLNTIWKVRPKPGAGIKIFLRARLLSLSMVLGIAFLLLVSLVISAALAAFGAYMAYMIGGGDVIAVLLQAGNFIVSLGIITILFTLLFKVLPDANIRWKAAWTGGFFTAVLFTIGKFLIALYLGKSDVASAYGAAGSLVLILLWIFYSSQILFFGAEFTQMFARKYGYGIEPEEYAEELEDQPGLRKTPKGGEGVPGRMTPSGDCIC